MEQTVRRFYPLILAAVALLLVVKIGSYPLLDPDEARFARTSLEMVRSGDYVVPTFEGEPRLVKPPLLHWLQAWLFRLFTPGEAAARIPAALATLGSVVLVGWVARRRFGEEARLWAIAVFATMPLVVTIGRVGTLDALLAVHVFAVVTLDIVAPDNSAQKGIAIGALLGLAFLIKGPVGVGAAVVVMLAGRTASGRDVVPALRTATAAVAAWCVVVLPWGLAFIERIGFAGAVDLLRAEVVERAVEGTSHVAPPWYYAPVIAVGCLPWAGPLLVGLFRTVGRRRDPGAQTALYAAGGLVAGLALFSAFKGKLPNYILPLMPLVALVVTWEIGQELGSPRSRRLGSSLLLVTVVAAAVGLGGAAAVRLEAEARHVAFVGAVVFGLAAVVGVAALVASRPRVVFGSAALASLVFLFAVVLDITDLLGERRSAKPLVSSVPELSENRPVVLVGMRIPSLTWYLDRASEKLASRDELAGRLERGDDALFIVDEHDVAAIPSSLRSRLREVGRGGKYRVYERAANR